MAKTAAWQTPTELAYMAGFFDGEGYVGISSDKPAWKNGGVYYRMRVNVTQKDPTVLLSFRKIYGGTLHKGKDGVWKWYIDGKKGCVFLSDMMPYLIIKKEQAKLALEFSALNTGKGKSTEAKKRQEAISKEIKKLKVKQYA